MNAGFVLDPREPLNLGSQAFTDNKWALLEALREQQPLSRVKISVIKLWAVSRYDDCTAILKDPRLLRNRTKATGGSRFPFPVPRSVKPLVSAMINEDDPEHRRQRDLVRHAFLPGAVAALESRLVDYSEELLHELRQRRQFDLQSEYALKIPTRMIADMMGVSRDAMPELSAGIKTLTQGFGGWRVLRSLFRDLPKLVDYMRGLIDEKKRNPGDDILTALVQAEADGDRLSDDELLSLSFLLIVAGFETTVHLISNGVVTLLEHPDQLERLRAEPHLMDSAVEEILRHRGPIQGTKLNYASEDIEMHGQVIAKGQAVMPLFGAANHDPRAFEDPQQFDIARNPNRHLGFGHGVHYCLGAHLARLETQVALRGLLQHLPRFELAVEPQALKLQAMPGWHRYDGVPLRVG